MPGVLIKKQCSLTEDVTFLISSIAASILEDCGSLSFHSSIVCCAALIGDSHVMGWGSKAIEIRAVENGQLDGVFMHKRTQKLRFLCERNDKVCDNKL